MDFESDEQTDELKSYRCVTLGEARDHVGFDDVRGDDIIKAQQWVEQYTRRPLFDEYGSKSNVPEDVRTAVLYRVSDVYHGNRDMEGNAKSLLAKYRL